MKRKQFQWLLFILPILLMVSVCWYSFQNRHEKIDTWSSALTAEKVELAEVARWYGTEAIRYTLSREDYDVLLPLLKTITEDVCSRREKAARLEDGDRLAFFYEGKLWLFKCCENRIVSLTFQDAETGRTYGCEGSQLYINSPELWNYIMDTAAQKAA